MMLSAPEKAALAAYSEGRIGWRAACKTLAVVDHGELHELLLAHGLPEPSADDVPLDAATAERFSALLKGDA